MTGSPIFFRNINQFCMTPCNICERLEKRLNWWKEESNALFMGGLISVLSISLSNNKDTSCLHHSWRWLKARKLLEGVEIIWFSGRGDLRLYEMNTVSLHWTSVVVSLLLSNPSVRNKLDNLRDHLFLNALLRVPLPFSKNPRPNGAEKNF